MGRVDQGVFTFWLLHHHFGRPLTYIGYGGGGLQVRDLLHVADLVELVDEQLADPAGLGRLRRQRRRRTRGQPLAARDDRALPGADRQRGPDRRSMMPGGPATFRYISPTARACSSAPAGDRAGAPGRCSPTCLAGCARTRPRSPPRWASSGEALGRDPGPRRGSARSPRHAAGDHRDARRGRDRARAHRRRRRERRRHRRGGRRGRRRAPADLAASARSIRAGSASRSGPVSSASRATRSR